LILEFLLPFAYIAVFGFIIWRVQFFLDDRLPRLFFLLIFLLKALLSLVYSYVFNGADTSMYYDEANVIIYPTLWHQPWKFIYLTLGPNGGTIPEFIRPEVLAMGYWGDTSDYMVVRFNALVRPLSFGNFYVHGVFMSFISLLGLVWLYRAYRKASGTYSLAVVAAIFLIPSVLFWGSGVHKEGLLLCSLGLFFYGCVQLAGEFSARNLLLTAAGTAFTYFIRDYVLLLLLPGMIAFFAACRNYIRIRFLVPLIYVVVIGLGVTLPVFDGKNIAEMIAFKQKQFKSLEAGNTQIAVKDFHPSLSNLISNLPAALKNSLLGPFLIKPVKPEHYLIIGENVLLMLACLLFPFIAGPPRLQPFMLMCLLFSVSLLILIGYIVPNVGAIVRYRSIALLFLFIFLYSGEKKIRSIFHKA